MPTLKQEYRQFLNQNFNGLVLRKPLFYNWQNGLRFNLQAGRINTDEYFIEAVRRAAILFESAFKTTDNVFMVLIDYKWRRRKIRQSNYSFRQIKELNKSQISFFKTRGLYEPTDKFDIRNIAIVKTSADKINHTNLLTAVAHTDFPSRQPRLDNRGFLTDKEIYFLNIDEKLIFHMYDDRGLDLISSDIKTLYPLYKQYNDWILDYDRESINEKFKKHGI